MEWNKLNQSSRKQKRRKANADSVYPYNYRSVPTNWRGLHLTRKHSFETFSLRQILFSGAVFILRFAQKCFDLKKLFNCFHIKRKSWVFLWTLLVFRKHFFLQDDRMKEKRGKESLFSFFFSLGRSLPISEIKFLPNDRNSLIFHSSMRSVFFY